MESWTCGIDFVAVLGSDLSIKILQSLVEPSDLLHAAAVSTSWRHLVKEGNLCKQLCLQMFPQLSAVCSILTDPLPSSRTRGDEHATFSALARSLSYSKQKRLVAKAIHASSTDHFYEGIGNTMLPGSSDVVNGRPFYWSSKGNSNPEVSESLVYQLVSQLCVVTEIHVQPHEGYDEVAFGCPVYSAKEVRFSLGHNYPFFLESDKFVWTYTSPVFPMIQRRGLQRFVLPEPVLCIGGILQIELLGRMIRHPLDDLYYVCVSHVQALGKVLSPEFSVAITDSSGSCILKHDPDTWDSEKFIP